jgi:hypothetical protein
MSKGIVKHPPPTKTKPGKLMVWVVEPPDPNMNVGQHLDFYNPSDLVIEIGDIVEFSLVGSDYVINSVEGPSTPAKAWISVPPVVGANPGEGMGTLRIIRLPVPDLYHVVPNVENIKFDAHPGFQLDVGDTVECLPTAPLECIITKEIFAIQH